MSVSPHRFARLCGFATTLLLATLSQKSNAAQVLLYYDVFTSSSVESIDPVTGLAGPSVTKNRFIGVDPNHARNIQIDSNDKLLWYADQVGNIRSLRLDSNAAGPMLSSSIFRGDNTGQNRHFSIDAARNLLYYSATDDFIQVIDLKTMKQVRVIPSSRFVGTGVHGYRHTTIDYVNQIMYYVASDNTIRSFHLKSFRQDVIVPSNRIVGASAGALRHLIYDANTRLIFYVTENNTFASINPVTKVAGPTVPSASIKGGAVGAGRQITLDAPVLKLDTTRPVLKLKNKIKITTKKAAIILRGTAKDAGGIVAVYYRINNGPLKTANGKNNWQIKLKLKVKKTTKVVIYALDRANQQSLQKKVTIKRRAKTA